MTGIHPYDWLLDVAGPIARTVADAAIALDVMAGGETRSAGSEIKGRRFGVPAFMLLESGSPPFEKETRSIFMKALDALRAAGAETVIDAALLPESFSRAVDAVNTRLYMMEGIEDYFGTFGRPEYRSIAAFERAVGLVFPLNAGIRSSTPFASDPDADKNVRLQRQKALAAYEEAFVRFKLDGVVYPALHTPSNDETDPRTAAIGGPHSRTAWVNVIGAPAVVVPAGFYANGLPFGVEFSSLPGKDGDLLGWARAYEQTAKARRPPVLKEK
jgi:Asp-tRNA(Asn)/Glu-tRNA(Gln) amidotransferase A subunit family amidase